MKKKTCILALLAFGSGVLKAPESPFGARFEENGPSPFERRPPEDASPFGRPEASSPFGEPRESSPFGVPPAPGEDRPERPPFGAPSAFGERTGPEAPTSFGRPGPEAPEFEDSESSAPEGMGEPSRSVMSASYDDHAPRQEPPAAQESSQAAEQQTMVDSTVDTFETEDSGNWLLKRVWWEKTEDVYEQIKQVFNDIMNARMEFVTQRNSLDREMDVFYGQMGLEEGPLQNIINKALELLKRDKTQQGFLNEKEEEFSHVIAGKDRDFEQLKLDIEALKDLDQKVDEALDTLFGQIDQANKYEQKAWENFKEIARELNDKVARKTYYETEALLKDIKNIQSYISDQFSGYFTQTIQASQAHSKSISAQMNILKQAGIDLKKQSDELDQARVASEKKVHEKPEQKKEVKKEEPKGFFSKVTGSISGFFSSIVAFFSSLGSSVMGWFVKEESVALIKKKSKAVEKDHSEHKETEKAEDKKTEASEKNV